MALTSSELSEGGGGAASAALRGPFEITPPAGVRDAMVVVDTIGTDGADGAGLVSARDRILAAAAEHGWTITARDTRFDATLQRGPVRLYVQFARTGTVIYASHTDERGGHDIAPPDRAGEVLGYLCQPTMAERQWALLQAIADKEPVTDAGVPLDAAVRVALDRIAELEARQGELIAELDRARSTVNFQVIEYSPCHGGAEPFPAAVMTPGEDLDGHVLRDGEWGMALGDPRELCLVIAGRRDDVLDLLQSSAEELERYYTAEHENALHLRSPEVKCPDCAPEEMACPGCDNTAGNGWAQRDRSGQPLPPDSVACGSCNNAWQPFKRESLDEEDDDEDDEEYDHSAAKEDTRNAYVARAQSQEDRGGTVRIQQS